MPIHLICNQLLLVQSHPLWVEVVLDCENVRAQLSFAQEFPFFDVDEAGMSHDVESLDKVTFKIPIDFHDGMWTIYQIVFTFRSIIRPWVS